MNILVSSCLLGAACKYSGKDNFCAPLLAALQAEGESVIAGAAHIARGYEDLAGTLASLGADAGYVRRAQRPLFENAPCAT